MATVVQAKVHIIGKLPINNLLLPYLIENYAIEKELNISVRNTAEELPSILKIHKTWLQPIYQYLALDIHAVENKQIIQYFNQQDAREILVPLLKAAYGFELTETQIYATFPTIAMIPMQDDESGSIRNLKLYATQATVFKCAEKIAKHARGSTLIALGQTPVYLVAMLKVINATLAPADRIEIIEIAYSGKPDLLRTNLNEDYWSVAFKNILTPSRENFFREYLRKHNIYPQRFTAKDKVFLLDFSTGQGIANFLLLFAKWFNTERCELPDLIFMNMSAKEKISLKKHGKWQPLPMIADLDFKITDNLAIGVDTFYLDLPYEIVINFASINHNFRMLPPFHAALWSKVAAEAVFTQYPQPSALGLLKSYHDYAVKQINSNN